MSQNVKQSSPDRHANATSLQLVPGQVRDLNFSLNLTRSALRDSESLTTASSATENREKQFIARKGMAARKGVPTTGLSLSRDVAFCRLLTTCLCALLGYAALHKSSRHRHPRGLRGPTARRHACSASADGGCLWARRCSALRLPLPTDRGTPLRHRARV